MSKEPRAPDYMAPIAGARSWRVAHNLWAEMGGLLWSRAMINPWPDCEEKRERAEPLEWPPRRRSEPAPEPRREPAPEIEAPRRHEREKTPA